MMLGVTLKQTITLKTIPSVSLVYNNGVVIQRDNYTTFQIRMQQWKSGDFLWIAAV